MSNKTSRYLILNTCGLLSPLDTAISRDECQKRDGYKDIENDPDLWVQPTSGCKSRVNVGVIIIIIIMMMMMITTTTTTMTMTTTTTTTTTIIIIIIIMIIFLERLSMLDYAEQVKALNIKHMQARHPKQHVSKQSCSNIQLSGKDR